MKLFVTSATLLASTILLSGCGGGGAATTNTSFVGAVARYEADVTAPNDDDLIKIINLASQNIVDTTITSGRAEYKGLALLTTSFDPFGSIIVDDLAGDMLIVADFSSNIAQGEIKNFAAFESAGPSATSSIITNRDGALTIAATPISNFVFTPDANNVSGNLEINGQTHAVTGKATGAFGATATTEVAAVTMQATAGIYHVSGIGAASTDF